MSSNHDLQASHKILTLLEESNSNSEKVLDNLPGIFIIINEKNEILRCNEAVSQLFQTTQEKLLRRSITDLFRKETWSIFENYISKLRDSNLEKINFELGLIDKRFENSFDRPYLWFVNKVHAKKTSEGQLYAVVGEDIADLRENERKLVEIFSSIPLGIMAINSNGLIEDNYSQFLEFLLRRDNLGGMPFFDLLFYPCLEKMRAADIEGARNVKNVLGQDEMVYDLMKTTFPKMVFYPIEGDINGGRWIRLTYNPILYSGKVERLLVILEDRTENVIAEKAQEKAKLLEDISVARVVQLKTTDQEVLPLVMEELEGLFNKFDQAIKVSTPIKDASFILHGIKGNARVSGFARLTEIAHSFESLLQNELTIGKYISDSSYIEKVADLKLEWDEIFSLYNALYLKQSSTKPKVDTVSSDLFVRYNNILEQKESFQKTVALERILLAINSSKYYPASGLEIIINQRIDKTIEQVQGKEVDVVYNWNNVVLDKNTFSFVSECLLHLINNSIDHGIETKEERLKVGKNSTGLISINVRGRKGIIHVNVEDNGGGIDVEAIREVARTKKIMSIVDLLEANDDVISNLIFHPGMSTAKKISDISGRGVGLSAVKDKIDEMGGTIRVKSTKGLGTSFSFSFKPTESININRVCRSGAALAVHATDMMNELTDEFGFSISLNSNYEKLFSSGVVYLDPLKSSLAFSTLIGHFAQTHKLEVEFSVEELSKLVIEIEKKEALANPKFYPDFTKTIDVCRYYIAKHDGEIIETENRIKIVYGHILQGDHLPVLKIGTQSSVSKEKIKDVSERVFECCRELGITYELTELDDAHLVIGNDPNSAKIKTFVAIGDSKKVVQRNILNCIESILRK